MDIEILRPSLDLLKEEYVLVQAWKKTASYIRTHNWYSDTLELDRAAVNLPRFLDELAEKLTSVERWANDSLRIVPAPKSQAWHVKSGVKPIWEPVDTKKTDAKLRPLAHVSLKDQVLTTAVMLCLANRVETLQGHSGDSINSAEKRKSVISYGNRLYCDVVDGQLRHRWGTGKLYRAYYQDYRSFLTRPELAAESVPNDNGTRVVIVHSDLRQFYDRVRPVLLNQKIRSLKQPEDDPAFYALAEKLLNWTWHQRDVREVKGYAAQAGLSDFSRVALPQGLVAAGFFANVALLNFDTALRKSLSQEIAGGVFLEDACRYVDDLRIVLIVDQKKSLEDIKQILIGWLQGLLNRYAEGLEPSSEKTIVATFRGDERPLIRQSRKMARIQTAISGGFDAIGGEEILDAVQGLIRSQQRYAEKRTENQGWTLSPVPDVRDATVARFAAGRFRSTFRSLRPLLANRESNVDEREEFEEDTPGRFHLVRTRAELDDEARAFALGLIENWVEDPSNVRLLLIGLDLWPAKDLLENVLSLLRPFTDKGGPRKAPRRVAWYCLSEIFRAGATETGFVKDGESLPDQIDLTAYRKVLWEEAIRLSSLPASKLPWYLRQQVLLYLATSDSMQIPTIRRGNNLETKHYRELIRFLKGDDDGMNSVDFSTFAILARRSFRGRESAVQLACNQINPRRLEQIAERDPSFALEILAAKPALSKEVSPRLRDDLCLERDDGNPDWKSLADLVLDGGPTGPLRNEVALLHFALEFLKIWPVTQEKEVITPVDVRIRLRQSAQDRIAEIEDIKIIPSRVAPTGSMYHPPAWCIPGEHWRFQLGYLLRFILSTREDFTKSVRRRHWQEGTATYRAPESHWCLRLYGLFNGHAAFGNDWLPISEWTEQLLSALLHWPGCRTAEMAVISIGPNVAIDLIKARLADLAKKQGPSSGVLMLPLKTRRPDSSSVDRPLRGCVMQTVIPTDKDFTSADLSLSNPAIRRKQRNHLSAALAAVERMLDLRETHKGRDGRLDWLILPELSVHPYDVQTHLLPFARTHKTIILAGMNYEELFIGQPLVNSALWVIPVSSATQGLQVVVRRQGKYHLAPAEENLNASGVVIQGFRPCQWLVGYEWSKREEDRPLSLTASICYDATDLRLVADLRHHSDVFAVPALNKDVTTFDQMALALHYHMFQMVIVANNGLYGGSNAYVPFKEPYSRQVFHLHGQPQASIAFFEIDNISAFIRRTADAKASVPNPQMPLAVMPEWKFPPAGL